jgi:soluble lytic murein transglycosylase-like protein
MIHAALWVASFLFLASVAFVVIAYAWRFILAGLALVLLAGLAFLVWSRVENQEAARRAATASPVQPTAVAPPAPVAPPANPVDLQDLRDSVFTALSAAARNQAPPAPEFKDAEARLAYLRWMGDMSERLSPRMPDFESRKVFLQTLWYESRRAGLDVSLTLGMVDSLSGFRLTNVSSTDARGYFGVNPRWASIIGNGDVALLFHPQTNMRFGCVIFRSLLDLHAGDVYASLSAYLADSYRLAPSDPAVGRLVDAVFAAQRKWVFIDPAVRPKVSLGPPSRER